jgi:superfamily I DNA/RNA helicase
MANELISRAPDRAKPPLEAFQEVDGDVAQVQWANLDEEVDGLTAAIARAVEQGQRTPGEILVLVHRQIVGERIRERLRELGVPAHSFFAQESVATDEAREALALLRLAVSNDAVAWRVLLGLGAADGRKDAYARLASFARDNATTEIEVLERLRGGEHLEVRVPAFVDRYAAAMARLAGLQTDDLPAVVEALLPEDTLEVMALREIALEELVDADDLAHLVDRIVVRVTQHDVPENPDFVRVMSFHKSKGLTSPVVYLACMVDGVIPTIRGGLSRDEVDAAYAEQRRLVYVALTRASEELVISSSIQMALGPAFGMGVRIVRERIRNIDGDLVAPTIASPYIAEFAGSAPAPMRGIDWLAERG